MGGGGGGGGEGSGLRNLAKETRGGTNDDEQRLRSNDRRNSRGYQMKSLTH